MENNERSLETVLKAISSCLSTPLVLENAASRREKLENERELTEAQERLYAPNTKQLFKQFSLWFLWTVYMKFCHTQSMLYVRP